jgi:hypothetical protein
VANAARLERRHVGLGDRGPRGCLDVHLYTLELNTLMLLGFSRQGLPKRNRFHDYCLFSRRRKPL